MDPRVLIVEDDPVIAGEVRQALEPNGYAIEACSTGRGAIEAASRITPDLVLLDLGLPDLDGLHVCRLLRADLPHTRS